jgi:hypothetical protein
MIENEQALKIKQMIENEQALKIKVANHVNARIKLAKRFHQELFASSRFKESYRLKDLQFEEERDALHDAVNLLEKESNQEHNSLWLVFFAKEFFSYMESSLFSSKLYINYYDPRLNGKLPKI